MKIYHISVNQPVTMQEEVTACIGYFDGLHVGHQKLIQTVLKNAEKNKTIPALITFDPDPWKVIKHIEHIPHLTPMKKRIRIAEGLGIRVWIILNFTEAMAALSIDQFHTLLSSLHVQTLVCGYDFHYGEAGKGNAQTLQQQSSFAVQVVEEVASEHRKISSTRIEELLKTGQIEKANQFMNRPYEIEGIVKKGNQIGRTVGFPTANLQMEENYVVLAQGVYIGEVFVKGKWYGAVMNIGHNPSFNFQQKPSLEAHILNFQDTIYGEAIVFRYLSFLRGECKFENKQAFMKQLHKDVQTAKCYFQQREV